MRPVLALVAAVVLCTVAGCSDDDDPTPGALLDEDVVALAGGVDASRIRYASVDVQGDPSEVTGLVAVPEGEPPPGGWPLVAVAHSTTGVADACAPSRDPRRARVGARLAALAHEGYVAVATDYEGLGTDGPHPYLDGRSAAQAIVDSVRAARELVPEAGERWAVVGHSQGGHAALFTAQEAAALAPELELVGAVANAPVTGLDPLVLEPGFARDLLAPLVAVGVLARNPDADAADVVTAAGRALVETVGERCSADVGGEPVLFAGSPVVAEYLRTNEPGGQPAVAPVLVLQGGEDELTTAEATSAAVERMCAQGDTVALRVYPTADHASVVGAGNGDALAWLADRFAGRPAPTTC